MSNQGRNSWNNLPFNTFSPLEQSRTRSSQTQYAGSKRPWGDKDSSPWKESPWKRGRQEEEHTWSSSTWAESNSKSSWPTGDSEEQTQGGAQLPAGFQPSPLHLDSQVVWGSPLFRLVQSSPWTRKVGLANKPMTTVTMADISFRGWEEPAVRWLSAGRYVSPVYCRSVSESVFVTAFLAAMRDAKIDLDSILPTVWATKHPDQTMPDKHANASLYMSPLARSLVEHIQAFQPVTVPEASPSEVAELKARIAELESRATASPVSSGKPATSTKPAANSSSHGRSARPKPAAKTQTESSTPNAFKPGRNNGPLKACSPKSATDFAVTAWLGKFKKDNIPEDRHPEFDTHVAEIRSWYQAAEETSRPDLKATAEKWGLSKALAGKLTDKSLLGLIATAAFAAA